MLTYICDWCRRARPEGKRWILGFAAERVGAAGMQREFSLAASWSEQAAQHPLAVHFCCEEHKTAYMNALFGEGRGHRSASGSTRRAAAAARHGSSSVSGVSLGGSLGSLAPAAEKPAPRSSGTRRVKKAKKVERAVFNSADAIRSRGLGVCWQHPWSQET